MLFSTRLIISILIVLIIGIASVLASASRQTANPITNTHNEPLRTSDTKNIVNNRYVDYSPQAFADASNKRRVLYFYASWCPTCRSIDTQLTKQEDEIPDDIIVFRINYDDNDTDVNERELATKYGITYQHTFVLIDMNENELTKWNGGGIETLIANTT